MSHSHMFYSRLNSSTQSSNMTNLVNLSVLYSMLNVYRVYYKLDACNRLEVFIIKCIHLMVILISNS